MLGIGFIFLDVHNNKKSSNADAVQTNNTAQGNALKTFLILTISIIGLLALFVMYIRSADHKLINFKEDLALLSVPETIEEGIVLSLERDKFSNKLTAITALLSEDSKHPVIYIKMDHLDIALQENMHIKIMGKELGTFTESNSFNYPLNIPVMKAIAIEIVNEDEFSVHSIPINKYFSQSEVKFTLQRIVISEHIIKAEVIIINEMGKDFSLNHFNVNLLNHSSQSHGEGVSPILNDLPLSLKTNKPNEIAFVFPNVSFYEDYIRLVFYDFTNDIDVTFDDFGFVVPLNENASAEVIWDLNASSNSYIDNYPVESSIEQNYDANYEDDIVYYLADDTTDENIYFWETDEFQETLDRYPLGIYDIYSLIDSGSLPNIPLKIGDAASEIETYDPYYNDVYIVESEGNYLRYVYDNYSYAVAENVYGEPIIHSIEFIENQLFDHVQVGITTSADIIDYYGYEYEYTSKYDDGYATNFSLTYNANDYVILFDFIDDDNIVDHISYWKPNK